MKKVESVYSWGSTTLANQDENADMITAVYPEDVLNDYAPDLSEGKWLTDADDKKRCSAGRDFGKFIWVENREYVEFSTNR